MSVPQQQLFFCWINEVQVHYSKMFSFLSFILFFVRQKTLLNVRIRAERKVKFLAKFWLYFCQTEIKKKNSVFIKSQTSISEFLLLKTYDSFFWIIVAWLEFLFNHGKSFISDPPHNNLPWAIVRAGWLSACKRKSKCKFSFYWYLRKKKQF